MIYVATDNEHFRTKKRMTCLGEQVIRNKGSI